MDWLTGLVEESFLFHDGFVAAKHAEKDEAADEQTAEDGKAKKEPKTKVWLTRSSISSVAVLVRGLGAEALWRRGA
jgi:hypothetical protein